MKNQNYGYANIEKWYALPEQHAISPALCLASKLGSMDKDRGDVDEKPAYKMDWDEAKRQRGYQYKTGSLDLPEVAEYWKERNVYYESRELAGIRWVVMSPWKNTEVSVHRLPLLVVFHNENYADPFWAMKTLDVFSDYNRNMAEMQDRVIIYVVTNNKPVNTGFFSLMILEAIQLFSCDKRRIYFDLSTLYAHQGKLSDVSGFAYFDDDQNKVENVDGLVESVFGLRVVNMTMRWLCEFSFGMNALGPQNGTMDVEQLIHSEMGKKIMDARIAMSNFNSPDEPEAQMLWEKMGLTYKAFFTNDERWVTFSPSGVSNEDKLPLVVVFHEVGEPNDRAILSGVSTYWDYCELAAQGECVVLFFALESADLNDLLCEIIKQAQNMLPIDPRRVYLTGHSHNGHYVQEFARRHPDIVAACAPLGNHPGLPTAEMSHEAVVVDDKRVAAMENTDMPCVVIAGCCEVGCMFPINKPGHASEAGYVVDGKGASVEGYIEAWNRRLKASRCPVQTEEAILAAEMSASRATRELGVPSDKSETVYMDGFEHYIADFKNVDGNYHLRIIGIENVPHMVVPSMNWFGWNYMRRFARNQVTGKTEELF